MTDWQALVEWMHSPEVEAAKARYADEPEAEEPGEPEGWTWICQWCGMEYPDTVPYCDCGGQPQQAAL